MGVTNYLLTGMILQVGFPGAALGRGEMHFFFFSLIFLRGPWVLLEKIPKYSEATLDRSIVHKFV